MNLFTCTSVMNLIYNIDISVPFTSLTIYVFVKLTNKC